MLSTSHSANPVFGSPDSPRTTPATTDHDIDKLSINSRLSSYYYLTLPAEPSIPNAIAEAKEEGSKKPIQRPQGPPDCTRYCLATLSTPVCTHLSSSPSTGQEGEQQLHQCSQHPKHNPQG